MSIPFEWNTIALIFIALCGAACTIFFNRYIQSKFKSKLLKSVLRLGIILLAASGAAISSLFIKPDTFGVLLVRALIIEFVAVYALREDTREKIIS